MGPKKLVASTEMTTEPTIATSAMQVVNPRIAHNRSKLTEFLTANNIRCQRPPIEQQVESVVVKGLSTGGYNGAIHQFEDKFVLVYRWHHNEQQPAQTRLAIAELDDNFNVTHNEDLDLNDDDSTEDGRIFVHDGKLKMVYVSSRWPAMPWSVVKVCELSKPDHWRASNFQETQPIGIEKQPIEKNFVPFVVDGEAFILYRSRPKQIIYNFGGFQIFESQSLHYPYGEIRGGCIIPWEGKLLRFFHCSNRLEMPPTTWRYSVGCVLMEPKPPFKMISVSKKPIVWGSEIGGDESARHFKKNIAIVFGAVERNGEILLSIGQNDSAVLIAKIKPEDLNL
jgi:predicted GH43/DUF377 family glycosyl hydrolase